ncbi:MAG: class I SAM-dependent methyltransferase [Chloroflexia bacterium]|nr:class I SAM-dependent methyltransferase [Chloroflexia bacterium]
MDEQAYFAAQERKSLRKLNWEYVRLLRLAGLQDFPAQRVLDAGCGAGPGLRFFSARGVQVCGLDRSDYALRRAGELAPSAHLVLGDLQRTLPFFRRAFDLVLLGDVFEHIEDGDGLLRECLRVLRPGGALLLRTVNRWDVRRYWQGECWSGVADPTHVHLYSPPELRQALREAGFVRVRVRTGIKPLYWLPLRWQIGIPWPPWVGNGLLAAGLKR